MCTRRRFCLAAGAVAALGPLTPARAARRMLAPFDVEQVRAGAWAITGQGGNALLVSTDEGPVLVDAKLGTAAAALRQEAVERAGRAPALLVNTHHHADHTGGNFAFSADARLLAHAKLPPRLPATLAERIRPALERHVETLRDEGRATLAATLQRRLGSLGPADFEPDQVVETELDLVFGGRSFQLRHFGPGHTDNDLAVFIPALNVLHAGDLLFHEQHPFIDRAAKASVKGWRRALVTMGRLCDDDTIVIPGHGDRTDATGLVKQHFYFQQLHEIVEKEMEAGRSREAIVAMEPAAFADLGGAAPSGALGAMYDELKDG